MALNGTMKKLIYADTMENLITINGNSIEIETNLDAIWECEREEDLFFAEKHISKSIENHFLKYKTLPYINHGFHVSFPDRSFLLAFITNYISFPEDDNSLLIFLRIEDMQGSLGKFENYPNDNC
tara:strand:- start:353 stop:727 length:375 start_codon:yes stop_codon:yes gene_type:complete